MIDRTVIVGLLKHAPSAARLVGHLDDTRAAGPLADHVDAIVHVLSELLGAPGPIAAADESVDEDAPTEVRERRAPWSGIPTKYIEVRSGTSLIEGGGRWETVASPRSLDGSTPLARSRGTRIVIASLGRFYFCRVLRKRGSISVEIQCECCRRSARVPWIVACCYRVLTELLRKPAAY